MIFSLEQLEPFEEWRQVVGYEGLYEVSNWGRIRGVAQGQGRRPGRLLSPYTNRKGYLCVDLTKEKINKTCQVHRLVTATFLGPCPLNKQVDHINGDKTNNTLKNLRYLTPRENNDAAIARRGPPWRAPGEKNPAAKLTAAQIIEIRRLHLEGMTQVALAKEFGVTQAAVWYIVRGKHWKTI